MIDVVAKAICGADRPCTFDRCKEQGLSCAETRRREAAAAISAFAAAGPMMPEEPPSEAIEAQCTDEWIGHPNAHQTSIDRWRAAQRVDARRRYSIIRDALSKEQGSE